MAKIPPALRGAISPPPSQEGDNFEEGGVSSLNSDANPRLTGDITLNGAKGLSAEQEGQEIRLLPPKLRYFANPRTPVALSSARLLARNTVYLFPAELSGYLALRKLYLQIVRDGTPDDNVPLMEIGIYKRNALDNGFEKEFQVQAFSFAQTSQLPGNIRFLSLVPSQVISAGQHFIALLYRYNLSGNYLVGAVEVGPNIYPGAGVYLQGSAGSLPESILDTDFSAYLGFLAWIELEGE